LESEHFMSMIEILLKYCYNQKFLEPETVKEAVELYNLNETYKVIGLNQALARVIGRNCGEITPPLCVKDMIVFSDITFLVEGESILLHKAVLGSRCSYLETLCVKVGFKEAMQSVIKLDDMSLAVFNVIIEFLYKDTADIPTAIVLDVLVKANEWGLNKLKQICEKDLSICIDKDNVISLILISETHEADYLLACCINVLFIHLDSLHSQEDFKHISSRVLKKLDVVRANYEFASKFTAINYYDPNVKNSSFL